MSDLHAPWRQQPLGSLATRIIAVVFVATFVTALVVSGIAVHSTYAFLRRPIEHSYPALLQEHAGRLEAWLKQSLAPLAAVGGFRTEQLREPELAALRASGPWSGLAVRAAGGPWRETGDVAGAEDGDEGVERAGYRLLAPSDPRAPGRLIAVVPLADGGQLRAALEPEALASQLGNRTFPDQLLLRLAAPDASLPTGSLQVVRSEADGFRVTARVPLSLLQADLVLDQPFHVAFEPVFAVVTRVFVMDLCILLLFSVLAYRITGAIVRPIEALSDGARRVSRGDLDVQIPDAGGSDEIGLLTRTFNDMTRELHRQHDALETANAKLIAQNDALQQANEVLEQLSITDGLTKLHNHRYFQDYLTREIKRVSRTSDPLAILLIDIDDFKRLNDRQGHAAGDELLARLANILNDSIRESDLVARYGGEEFVVLAPNTELTGAINLAEKVRTAVAETSFILSDTKQLTRMTVSVGVSMYRGSRKAFFHAADQALYRAKAAGKNCVMVYEEGEDGEPWDRDRDEDVEEA